MPRRRGPGRTRQTSTHVGGSPAPGSPPTRRRPAATAGPEAMPPRRSPRALDEGPELQSCTCSVTEQFEPGRSDSEVIVDSEMPKTSCKFGKSPSCWNLEHACPRSEIDFCSSPPLPQEFKHSRRMRRRWRLRFGALPLGE